MPKISDSVHSIATLGGSSSNSLNQDNQGNIQNQEEQKEAYENSFNGKYQQAQQKHWQTGQWGNARYFIDDDNQMHVGSGQLLSNLANNIGNNTAQSLTALDFDEPVKAPQNSSFLLSTSNAGIVNDSHLTTINGLDKMDTSQATDMDDMFSSDHSLNNLDLSHWDVSHVQSMGFAFYNDWGLTNLNVDDWNTSHVSNMFSIFSGNGVLDNLNVGSWDTHNVTNLGFAFYNDWKLHDLNLSNWSTGQANMSSFVAYDNNLKSLELGNNTRVMSNINLNGTYQDDGKSLNTDGNSHPGTWVKQ